METWTETCGPYPVGLIVTPTHKPQVLVPMFPLTRVTHFGYRFVEPQPREVSETQEFEHHLQSALLAALCYPRRPPLLKENERCALEVVVPQPNIH